MDASRRSRSPPGGGDQSHDSRPRARSRSGGRLFDVPLQRSRLQRPRRGALQLRGLPARPRLEPAEPEPGRRCGAGGAGPQLHDRDAVLRISRALHRRRAGPVHVEPPDRGRGGRNRRWARRSGLLRLRPSLVLAVPVTAGPARLDLGRLLRQDGLGKERRLGGRRASRRARAAGDRRDESLGRARGALSRRRQVVALSLGRVHGDRPQRLRLQVRRQRPGQLRLRPQAHRLARRRSWR